MDKLWDNERETVLGQLKAYTKTPTMTGCVAYSAAILNFTTWKVIDFVGRDGLRLLGWHQYLQHFIAGFALGKIPLA